MLLCWVGFLSFPRTVLCLLIGKLQTICTSLLWSWDFLHRWPRFKYVTLLIGSFLVALDLVGIFFFCFFNVHLIWDAEEKKFLEALTLRSTGNVFKNCTKEKWMSRWFIQCLKDMDLLKQWVSYLVCKKKKKSIKVESYMFLVFFLFFFFCI